jgi:hypothetical protein
MATENEDKKVEEGLSEEQLAGLQTPPPEEAYRRRTDDKLYLPIGYYPWGVACDHSTLRFEVQNHPVTHEPIGALCTISTTLTVRGCLPITVTGHAPVQFLNNLSAYQNISIYDLAVRAAEARGLKKAFAYYGAAFICATSEEEIRRQNSAAVAVHQETMASPVTPTLGEGANSHLTLVSSNSQNGNGASEVSTSEIPSESGKIGKSGRGRAGRNGTSVATSEAETSKVKAAASSDERIVAAEAVLSQPAPWDEATSASVAVAPNSKDNEAEAEAGGEGRLSAEQQATIERLVRAKGYPLSAADGTAQKLYGAKVADLTVAQADGLIGKLERLKARAA